MGGLSPAHWEQVTFQVLLQSHLRLIQLSVCISDPKSTAKIYFFFYLFLSILTQRVLSFYHITWWGRQKLLMTDFPTTIQKHVK